MQDNGHPSYPEPETILGVSTRELAGLTVDELVDNPTAIKMLMHYYKKLVGENAANQNELNIMRTYVDGYQRKKTYAGVGTLLLATSNILVAFGVNLLTVTIAPPGVVTLASGILVIALGLYFSTRDAS